MTSGCTRTLGETIALVEALRWARSPAPGVPHEAALDAVGARVILPQTDATLHGVIAQLHAEDLIPSRLGVLSAPVLPADDDAPVMQAARALAKTWTRETRPRTLLAMQQTLFEAPLEVERVPGARLLELLQARGVRPGDAAAAQRELGDAEAAVHVVRGMSPMAAQQTSLAERIAYQRVVRWASACLRKGTALARSRAALERQLGRMAGEVALPVTGDQLRGVVCALFRQRLLPHTFGIEGASSVGFPPVSTDALERAAAWARGRECTPRSQAKLLAVLMQQRLEREEVPAARLVALLEAHQVVHFSAAGDEGRWVRACADSEAALLVGTDYFEGAYSPRLEARVVREMQIMRAEQEREAARLQREEKRVQRSAAATAHKRRQELAQQGLPSRSSAIQTARVQAQFRRVRKDDLRFKASLGIDRMAGVKKLERRRAQKAAAKEKRRRRGGKG